MMAEPPSGEAGDEPPPIAEIADAPPLSTSGARHRRRNVVYARLSELGASAQAAIPGLYAWSITVAPAAWSRGAPIFAKVAAIIGVIALTTAPLVEGAGLRAPPSPPPAPESGRTSLAPPPPKGLAVLRGWTGPT